MRPLYTLLIAVAAFVLGATMVWLVQRNPTTQTTAPTATATTQERKVLYWYDPMAPAQHFDKPGKSPFMDMPLTPKYADSAEGGAGVVQIDPRLVQNLGVRTAIGRRGTLATPLRATGTIAYDERAVTMVPARVAGIVERLLVRAPQTTVRRGQPLLVLLAPEWTAAQEEYLALRHAAAPGMDTLRQAARQRLQLLGMDEAQIAAVERTGRAQTRITIAAPQDGVIGELLVREGASVAPGMPLLRLNGLDTVWVEAAIPEAQVARLASGASATISVPAFPGESFDGTVDALLPQVDAVTRTQVARIVLRNPAYRLAPGMFARIELTGAAGASHLLIPSEAVIVTGTRSVVIVAEEDARFRAQEIRRGEEANGRTEVLDGLADGDRVVLSGQFLIDSEASLGGTLARLEGAASDKAAPSALPATSAGVPMHVATGTLRSIEGEHWRIDADAIATLDMGAMSMDFVCPASIDKAGIRVGQRIAFHFVRNAAGDFEITHVTAQADQGGKP